MQTLDYDPDIFKNTRAAEMDKGLAVRFFLRERQDGAATEEAGRPIFRDVEYIEIRVPGQRDVQACRPATFDDKRRFSEHYERFKARSAEPEVGTPLSQWPAITRSRVEELSFLNVKTVEQLAGMHDGNVSRIQGGYKLRQTAIDWLEKADGDKLLKEKRAMQERMEAMQAQIDRLESAAGTPSEPEPRTVESDDADHDATEPPAVPTSRRRSRRHTESS